MNFNTLDILRTQTNQLHKKLDSHELLSALINPNISKKEYIQSLSALYKPQKDLEICTLIALSKYFPGYDYRKRYPYIEKDLYNMNSEPVVYEPLGFSINSKSELLGYLYVLEGSKLGAKSILKNLSKKDLPICFFSSACNKEGSNFSFFIKLIADVDDICDKQLSNAAINAFNMFINAIPHTNIDK